MGVNAREHITSSSIVRALGRFVVVAVPISGTQLSHVLSGYPGPLGIVRIFGHPNTIIYSCYYFFSFVL